MLHNNILKTYVAYAVHCIFNKAAIPLSRAASSTFEYSETYLGQSLIGMNAIILYKFWNTEKLVFWTSVSLEQSICRVG